MSYHTATTTKIGLYLNATTATMSLTLCEGVIFQRYHLALKNVSVYVGIGKDLVSQKAPALECL